MKKLLLLCCLFIGLTTATFAQPKAVTKPEEKAMELQKKLKLTDPQCKKVAAIYTESSAQFDKIKAANHGDNTKMLVAIEPLRTSTIKKIKDVLTPAQKTKYDALVKESKASGSGGWSDGWSAAK
jgi:Spy/CpxP family protein refolding chaperone